VARWSNVHRCLQYKAAVYTQTQMMLLLLVVMKRNLELGPVQHTSLAAVSHQFSSREMHCQPRASSL